MGLMTRHSVVQKIWIWTANLDLQKNLLVMLLLYIILAVLDSLGLLSPWLLVVVVLFIVLIYLDIVSGLITYRSHDP